DTDLPKPLWKSPIFVVSMTICLLLFLFGGYIFFLWAPPLVISTETTRVTGPLTAKGGIDFFKALEQRFYPPELATDDNGFRDFIRLFGDIGNRTTKTDPEFYRLQRYEKLGLDPNIAPALTLPVSANTFISRFYIAKGEINSGTETMLITKPWTLEQVPMLEEWVKDIDTPLDAIAETIRKPVFFAPFLQSNRTAESGNLYDIIQLQLSDAGDFREISRAFQSRATYRVGTGNVDGAIEDKLTLMRLGRFLQRGLIVNLLTGIAIEGVGTGTPVGENHEHPLTEKQIRRLLEGIDALPPRVPLNEVFEYERYAGLSLVQEISQGFPFGHGPGLGAGLFSLDSAAFYFCNWNVVYRRINELYDAMQEPSPRTKFHSLLGKTTTTPTFGKVSAMLNPTGRGMIVADFLISTLYSNSIVEKIKESVRRMECTDNIQRLSLAVLLYQFETGKLPDENWAAQIEKYLGENPKRYFSCLTNPSPEGETTYAMVKYADAVGGSRDILLFVELKAPVPLEKAVVSVDDVFNRRNTGSLHSGGMNTGHHSAAVRFLSNTLNDEELLRLLGL
ncbi:MAG: hypothetical protein FWE67_14775, partial [Planctomycetaceae bacterium]|nr:hypothetical protein [Planctomycetaceae bacterium]